MRPRHRWEHILKMGLTEVGCKGVYWIPWSSGRHEHMNEFLGSIKDWNDCDLLRNNSSPIIPKY